MRYRNFSKLLGLLCVSPAYGGLISPENYDENKDGYLSKKAELPKFLENVDPPRVDEVDQNENSVIDPHEVVLASKMIKERADEALAKIEKNLGENDFYKVSLLRKMFLPFSGEYTPSPSPDPERDTRFDWQVHLRESHEDLSITEHLSSDSSAAGISFGRNIIDDTDSWDIDAALILRKRLVEDGANTITFLPSLTLNYAENNSPGGEGEEDTLTGRFGFEFSEPVNPDFTSFYRVHLATTTDTDFHSIQETLELEWEPVILNSWIGAPKTFHKGKLGFHFRPILHTELGYVFDAGDKKPLQEIEDDLYARIGPKLKLNLWNNYTGFERLSSNISFSHYEGLNSNFESGTFFEAAIKYKLDERGNSYLKLEYEHGEIPLSLDEVDKLTLGLGLKM